MKRGFTIVELLLVIGIIAILMGIVTTAASSSITSSRSNRGKAICAIVQTALATYREQKGQWPIDLAGKTGGNTDVIDSAGDDDRYILSATEVRTCVRALVDEVKRGNPLLDVSGLWVSGTSDGEPDMNGNARGNSYGMSFMDAVRGTKRSKKKMKMVMVTLFIVSLPPSLSLRACCSGNGKKGNAEEERKGRNRRIPEEGIPYKSKKQNQ